jgi:acylphosphatase
MSQVRAHLLISGRVQGVWYRGSTQETAISLGLTGWVRNLPGGQVEAIVEGERAVIQQLIDWCRQGPPAARVSAIETRWMDATGEFDGFRVR